MTIKIYGNLPAEAAEIRKEVFCGEQGFKCEFDETDEIATHFVAYYNRTPIATCRVYDDASGCYSIGRIAVLKPYRGKGVGASLLDEAQKFIIESGGKEIHISAQARASGFYSKLGFFPAGEIYYDESCPHMRMIKYLK